MAYYTETQLKGMGFKQIGRHVKISDKATLYDCHLIEIGDNTRIDDFCVISGRLTIGRNVHITPQCLIAGGEPGIILEDFTTVAYGVKIFSQSDDYSGCTMTNSTVPLEFKNETKAQVIIKKHSIIGAGSVIMPGVVLEEGTSVGAMSLMLSSSQPWGIYVGIPAKRMKERQKDLLNLAAQYVEGCRDTV